MPIFTDQIITSNINPAQNTTTGALIVAGGAAINGHLIAKRIYTIEGVFWLNNAAQFVGRTINNGVGIGATGMRGLQGASGLIGVVGPAGPGGEVGNQGSTGPIGPVGATGVQGATGLTGATGPTRTGALGPRGATGLPGFASKQGATGSGGPQGEAGATGPTGETGPLGPTGDPGGATGATGDTGFWTYSELTKKHTNIGGEYVFTYDTTFTNYYINGLSGDLTPKFMSLPPLNTALGTGFGQSIVFVLTVQQNSSPHTITPNIKIGTTSHQVRWLNSTVPVGDANRLDVFTFCCLQLGAAPNPEIWVVTGQCGTYGIEV